MQRAEKLGSFFVVFVEEAGDWVYQNDALGKIDLLDEGFDDWQEHFLALWVTDDE